MKQIVTFFSIISLIWAAAASLRFAGRSLPWIVPAYLVSQSAFALIGWWGLQRASLESSGYLLFFGIGFGVVVGLAYGFSFFVAFVNLKILGIWLIVSAMSLAASICTLSYYELTKTFGTGRVPAQLVVALVQAGVLLFSGMVTLPSLLHAPLAPELRFVATAFGLFWASLGVFSLAWSVGVMRNRQVWLHLNDFLPAFMAVVAFTWLAIQLSGLQRELSREPVPQTVSQKAVA